MTFRITPDEAVEIDRGLELKEAEGLLTLAFGVDSETWRSSDKTEERKNLFLLALRMLNVQLSSQTPPIPLFARTLFLLSIDDFSGTLSNASPFDLLFQQRYECSVKEYLAMMFMCWTHCVSHSILNVEKIFENSSDRLRLTKVMSNVLDDLAIPLKDIRVRSLAELSKHRGESLVQAFYSTNPFIKLKDGWYLSPPHPFMLFHATNGVLFKSLELAREQAVKEGSEQPFTNIYSTAMGLRFERLLDLMFAKIFPPGDIQSEYEYLIGQNNKSPDLVVFEEPSQVILVQSKLKRLRPGAFYAFDYEELSEDIGGAIAESIWKSIRYLYLIDVASKSNRLRPANKTVSARVLASEKILLLGLFPLLPPLFSLEQSRKLIEEAIERKLSPEELKWYVAEKHRIAWHIIDFQDLASFVAGKREKSLFKAILSYLAQKGFGAFASDGGIIKSFGHWLEVSKDELRTGVPELADAFERFTNFTLSLFSG